LALSWWLQKQNLKHELFCISGLPDNLAFLPGSHLLQTGQPVANRQTTYLFIDCGSLAVTGLTEAWLSQAGQVINLDHHQTNTLFGTLNLVESTASSTCEMIVDFFTVVKANIFSPISTCLLTGILSDTGGLTFANTTSQAINKAARLFSAGANLPGISAFITRNKTIPGLQLWGEALANLQSKHGYGLVLTVINSPLNADNDPAEGLANFLNSLGEGKMTLVLRQFGDKIKGSLRSTVSGVDVSKLAQALGGGGHAKAAGFTISGTLAKTAKGWQIL
jgi:phosphoesterase RecJ-like protein